MYNTAAVQQNKVIDIPKECSFMSLVVGDGARYRWDENTPTCSNLSPRPVLFVRQACEPNSGQVGLSVTGAQTETEVVSLSHVSALYAFGTST